MVSADSFATIAANALPRRQDSLGYYGDISPSEAYDYAKVNPSIIVDVRTEAEWQQVGVPLIEESQSAIHYISWALSPDYRANPAFLAELEQLVTDKTLPLFFLCRVGGRSAQAATLATQMGYTYCFNIIHGFEGEPDASGKRGLINGWKAEGLPWKQA